MVKLRFCKKMQNLKLKLVPKFRPNGLVSWHPRPWYISGPLGHRALWDRGGWCGECLWKTMHSSFDGRASFSHAFSFLLTRCCHVVGLSAFFRLGETSGMHKRSAGGKKTDTTQTQLSVMTVEAGKSPMHMWGTNIWFTWSGGIHTYVVYWRYRADSCT